MLTLAIDTSGDICTLGLGNNEQILAEYQLYNKMNLLKRIVVNIEQMLADAEKTANDLDGIIIALGPGSFTGLRIGITVAKTMAFTLNKPIVGIPTLDVLAHGVIFNNADELVCPMIHARADEVYWALYDSNYNKLHDYSANKIDEVLEIVSEQGKTIKLCGNGININKQKIDEKLGHNATYISPIADKISGKVLVNLGCERILANNPDNSFTLTPLYIRKPTPVVRLEAGELKRR